jgi:membrane protease YdiL (CAAX protease family)
VLFVLVVVYHAFSLSFLKYLIPVLLLAIPLILRGRINGRFSVKDGALGILASTVLLLPFWFFLSQTGKVFHLLPPGAILFQLFGISLPEEAYFRGFLQQSLGNTMKGLLVTSIFFSFMHLPQFLFYGDVYSLLTFFPSLVMGFLYLRTSNILPSTVFHFLSNIVFLGFYDIL